jgi:phosphatidylinositol alpha-1,6-mannosyltransferase
VICGGVYAAGWLFNTVPNRIARINYVLGEELTQEISGGPWSRYLRRQQLRALQTADANIALSRFTAAALAEMVGAQAPPVHLQPGSVDTDHFRVTPDRGEQRKRWGWAGRMVLLTVARLVARKGIDRVLHALSFLRTQHRLPANWLYVIAGHGPEQQRLRALSVELGLSEHVRFTGFVADDDLPGLYNAADVFILANRDLQGDTEGFGLVFLEASACGLPVIGGGEGGTGDAIESGVTGLRVDAEDVAALADSISLLMTDGPLRERFARAGLERVNQRFSITSGAARFEQLLQTIHAEHTATRGQRRSRIS